MARYRPSIRVTRLLAYSAVLALLAGLAASPGSVAAQEPGGTPQEPAVAQEAPADGLPIDVDEQPRLVRLHLPDTATIKALEAAGVDITHDVGAAPDGTFEVEAVMRPSEERDLPAGVTVLERSAAPQLDELQEDFFGNVQVAPDAAGDAAAAARGADQGGPGPGAEEGSVRVLRADWFSNYAGVFLSIEARSANGPDDALTVTFDDGSGAIVTIAMDAFVDAGQYLYHRFSSPEPIAAVPEAVTVTSADGTSATAPTREWAPVAGGGTGDDYQEGFVNQGYMDAVQTTQRIEDLAAEFPALTELIDLPYPTHGYRREAQAFLGSTTSNAFYLLTKAYGHEGGNDLVLQVVDPATPDAPLTVAFDGTTVTVSLATDAAGAVVSTAAEVVAALNADPDVSAVATAYTYRGNAGGDVVDTGTVAFSDGLNAPAHVPRAPFQVKALRISGDLGDDGRRRRPRTGVLIYCQEHAREWVTPLVCLETAERLLRNHGSDRTTTRLVGDLDIFIIPTVNPDGTNYSMYDYNFQRKNLANYCDPADSDMLRWSGQIGVDVNRNFTIGSLFDGYDGASDSCISGVYAGPAESSEPEASNERWIVEEYDHIRFAMNTHSHGGYFMWSPGAYIADGRVPLPRPSLAVEDYFFAASEHILGRIREHRGTVIHPGRTGPVIDVLYSAAGNSADDHYYFDQERRDPEIFAWNFEVGAERWTGSAWESQGFQPGFEEEGFAQAMEFADGMIGYLEVARAYANDDDRPRSRVNVRDGRRYRAPVDVVFTVDEPATIHYTTDGSRPDLDSPTLERVEFRDVAETLRIERTTTLKGVAVDIAGNVERGYRPDGRGHNYNRVTIRIRR